MRLVLAVSLVLITVLAFLADPPVEPTRTPVDLAVAGEGEAALAGSTPNSAAGAPPALVRILLVDPTAAGTEATTGGIESWARPEADGRFRVGGLRSGPKVVLARWSTSLTAVHYRRLRVDLAPGECREIGRIEATTGCEISGRIERSPVEGSGERALLVLECTGAEGLRFVDQLELPCGRGFEIGGLPAGTLRIRARGIDAEAEEEARGLTEAAARLQIPADRAFRLDLGG